MTKFTKRQYNAEIAANEAAIAAVVVELSGYNDRVEAGERISDELSNAWNAAHDRQYELEQERASIERRWSTRNWTHADHMSYELVAQNID
ncbi:hypothetical protein EVB39_093 [Rhizobium phage RHph_TM3_3_9]|nr:hypothetical protein EVB39_093 [Rhizobium phage RHph_TM3_3_9]QIG68614.1 hypothetical protein EVB66_093 [Rhizobium phage RHph_TM3_3_13]QIG74472.1 hypothetical protein EVC09_092 [Rhizobium phage RHph_TM3_3_10]QXV74586.1 hypothetical protein [Rhizobium phage RHEph19]